MDSEERGKRLLSEIGHIVPVLWLVTKEASSFKIDHNAKEITKMEVDSRLIELARLLEWYYEKKSSEMHDILKEEFPELTE